MEQKSQTTVKNKKERYHYLDDLRGLTLLSMIAFHTTWDLVYIFGNDWAWYQSQAAYVWQQSICWTFILLSGFCWNLGKKKWTRGLMVFGCGFVVSLVTILFMPEDLVLFGVLTLIGSCMLLLTPLDKILRYVPAMTGMITSFAFFVLARNVNNGYLGFESWNLWKLPDTLYQGNLMSYLGFTDPSFYSTDYFSLFPWIFLYLTGYFLYQMVQKKGVLIKTKSSRTWCKPLEWIGRHSLPIYMLHQPVVFGLLTLLYRFIFV